MKETTQSFEKPLERHWQNKLVLTVQENGSINPMRKPTQAIHPKFVQKVKWQKWKLYNMDVWCNKTQDYTLWKSKNSKKIKFSQFSSEACNDINA
jgi:hypothetical protein